MKSAVPISSDAIREPCLHPAAFDLPISSECKKPAAGACPPEGRKPEGFIGSKVFKIVRHWPRRANPSRLGRLYPQTVRSAGIVVYVVNVVSFHG